MRYKKFFTLPFALLLILAPLKGQNMLEKMQLGRYPLIITPKLPDGIAQQIVVVSTRYFDKEKGFSIKRNVHPKYEAFMFVAGVKNDTSFVQPVNTFKDASTIFHETCNFLIYVDGHGKSFPQALERGYEISKRFKVNVVVFDWPSDYLALRKTVYSADEVSVGFVETMIDFANFRDSGFPGSAVSVIFHSMGNRILKNISNPRLLKHMPRSLFTNIIINAAAVKRQNHARWVERLNIQKRIYITMNETDFNLRGATILRLAEQLGSGLKQKRMRAENALYIDFNGLETVEHNLFLENPELEEKNPNIFRFYDMAFRSEEVKLPENAGVHILRPSAKSFLFSDKKSALESP